MCVHVELGSHFVQCFFQVLRRVLLSAQQIWMGFVYMQLLQELFGSSREELVK